MQPMMRTTSAEFVAAAVKPCTRMQVTHIEVLGSCLTTSNHTTPEILQKDATEARGNHLEVNGNVQKQAINWASSTSQ